MKTSAKIYSGIVFAFLFAPILVLLVFSFNEAKSLSVFSEFSLKWYKELFHDRNTLEGSKKYGDSGGVSYCDFHNYGNLCGSRNQ